MQNSELLIFAGLSAVGKTTLAENLEREYGFIRIDKDDPSFPSNAAISKRLAETKDSGIDFWRTDECKKILEPQLYLEVFERARQLLAEGKNCIIDAPLLYEAREADFLETVKNLTQAVKIQFFWFRASPEKIKTSMYTRNADRDYAKLCSPDAWQSYIDGIDFSFHPPFVHKIIDTSAKNAQELFEDFKNLLNLRYQPPFAPAPKTM